MDKNLTNLWKIAKSYASKRGLERYSEDFAQEVCIAHHNKRKSTISQLYIDFMRKNGGDNRNNSNGFYKAVDGFAASSIEDLHEMFACIEQKSERDFFKLIKPLNTQNRIIAILIFKWGFNQKEVAEVFGVTEACIGLWISDFYLKLKTRIKIPKLDRK